MTLSLPDILGQPLLAVFPHGLQHHARRNAYRATGLAAATRRDREAVDAAVQAAVAAAQPPLRSAAAR